MVNLTINGAHRNLHSKLALMLQDAIDTLFDRYQKSFEALITPYDADWPSPCELGEPWHGENGECWIKWAPVRRHPTADDFSGLESGLGFSIHDDIKTHYGRYWSDNLETEAPDGHVSLLYLWNLEDVDRLIENLIGHAVACRHNRTPFSVFFACTEPDSNLFLTINNETGAVQLEEPGKKPLRTVSSCLEEFLLQLTPADQRYPVQG